MITKIIAVLTILVGFSEVSYAGCAGNKYLKMQECSKNLDDSLTITNPFVLRGNDKVPLIRFDDNTEFNTCRFFGLTKVVDVATAEMDESELVAKRAVMIALTDDKKSVEIYYRDSYWDMEHVFTSLTCME